MDRAQCTVAILYRVRDDAYCQKVVDLVHRDALSQQLLVDGVEPLDTPVDANGIHAILVELQSDQLDGFFEERFSSFSTLFHRLRQLLIRLRFDQTERQSFKFAADLTHAAPMRHASV